MKVIALNGSPHSGGTIYRGLEILTGELEKEGISIEHIHVGNKEIRGCIDCKKCRETGRCAFDNDLVNQCRDKLIQADGLILGSPVYYGGVAGTFKSFLDRLFFPHADLRYKVGATVVSLRRSGGIAVFHQLNNYLNLAQMIITPTFYWDVIHGNSPEELEQDGEGMQIMRVTGRNMAWLLKALEAGKKAVSPPEPEKRIMTNFIH
ncbi:flavin reductase [Treponema primitia ZAS-2]|uniref:Flavin reductase n=1 Tax=Treponema primitia (strain ATCC BAA-887 / DSM 12427 / ZAS-2) TaxID=545694 RepID=F5YPD1_TREPZ|nr:flavodoxin family protein [Treponema primitia]AEF86210.1 flavin reductase [Treponema primitia ZAS-2]